MSKVICCGTCKNHLGGGACRINLEADCGEGGYEAWELEQIDAIRDTLKLIDRLAQEPDSAGCKYCSTPSSFLAVIEGVEPRIFISVSGAYLQVFDEEYPGFIDNSPIYYCPMCGRKLTDRKEQADATD